MGSVTKSFALPSVERRRAGTGDELRELAQLTLVQIRRDGISELVRLPHDDVEAVARRDERGVAPDARVPLAGPGQRVAPEVQQRDLMQPSLEDEHGRLAIDEERDRAALQLEL